MSKNYTPIVGLEIHVELKTKYKMFCGCSTHHFHEKPNTNVCPVCLGLPGALPVPNKKAIDWCQLIGLSLNCKLAKFSKFDRKNYFYPDLPKAYQISQYDQPFCQKGFVTLDNGKKIGITRVHMEEDTAKNSHKDGKTLVDFNRSSVPLVEIVTEPDFRNKEDIDEFLKKLRTIIRYLDVSDADMEKGSMRLELNMSLTRHPEQSKGSHPQYPDYKVEVKNINSFKYLQKAFAYEFTRQAELLDSGKTPDQETRGYQEDVNKTISQRSKENAQDYRYFPEPDIPPFEFTDKDFDKLKSQLPELPDEKTARFQRDFNLSPDLAKFMTQSRKLADYFEKALSIDKNLKPTQIANIIKNKKYDWTKLNPEALIAKIQKESSDKISDPAELEPIIKKVLDSNPKIVADYKAGKVQVIGFLMGQVMQESRGKADPQTTKKLLKENLK